MRVPLPSGEEEDSGERFAAQPTLTPRPPPLFATTPARCPFDFRSDKDMPPGTVHSLERVTRHPMLWSLAAVGAGAALRARFVSEVVMFGFPVVFALVGGAHQDYRYRRGSGGLLSPEKDAVTSNIPFGALVCACCLHARVPACCLHARLHARVPVFGVCLLLAFSCACMHPVHKCLVL